MPCIHRQGLMANSERPNSIQKYIWMPSLKVWVSSPFRSPATDEHPILVGSHGKCPKLLHTKRKFLEDMPGGRNLPCRRQEKRSKLEVSQLDSHCNNHGCPICLGRVDPSELAILRLCMHKFCIKCIGKWSKLQRKCPLCKREFDGWFYDIRGSGNYRENLLAPLAEQAESSVDENSQRMSRIETRETDARRSLNEVRGRILAVKRRSRALPEQRSFGRSKFVSFSEKRRFEETCAAQRALKWRGRYCIYTRGLRAIPLNLQRRNNVRQKFAGDLNEKSRMERRLEPWICRELEAILGDKDPSLLLHLVLSLWFSSLRDQEGKQNIDLNNGYRFVRQLEPFLDDKADSFWHELRCFAESPFTMSAYDSVVQYRKPSVDT